MLQVIEHIPSESIPFLMSAIHRAIVPGGLILIETINLKHPYAFHVFYTDPTHVRPVSSDFLVFLAQWVGFVRGCKIFCVNSQSLTGVQDWEVG
jgi:O-antigen chain-terminating methyltransferase